MFLWHVFCNPIFSAELRVKMVQMKFSVQMMMMMMIIIIIIITDEQ